MRPQVEEGNERIDLLSHYVARIDTKVCPVYLVAGEQDCSCTPEDMQRTGK